MLMVTNTDDDQRMVGCYTQVKDGDDAEAKEDDSLTPCGHTCFLEKKFTSSYS